MGTPIQQLFDLTGRVALVTGGSRGLGLQMAEALGEAGAKVMLTARKAADLEAAVAELGQRGIDARWIAADSSQPDEIARVVAETRERLGDIDILVNNAGVAWGAPAEDHPLSGWDKLMNLNVRTTFLFSPGGGQGLHDSAAPRQHHQHLVDDGFWRQSAGAGNHRLQHQQGRGGQFHQGAGGRMGRAQHQRQRVGTGLFPQQDDRVHHRPHRQGRHGPLGAAQPPGR